MNARLMDILTQFTQWSLLPITARENLAKEFQGGNSDIIFLKIPHVKVVEDEQVIQGLNVALSINKDFTAKQLAMKKQNTYLTNHFETYTKKHLAQSNRIQTQYAALHGHSPFIQTYLYTNGDGKVITLRYQHDLFYFAQEQYSTPRQLKEIIAQMILAVFDLHQHQLVHRDIKPNNFLVRMIGQSSHVQLADLETLATVDTTGKPDHFIEAMATDYFSAPEVLAAYPRRGPRDDNQYNQLNLFNADIYSLARSINCVFDLAEITAPPLQKSLSSMLTEKPAERSTLHELMQNPFFWRDAFGAT